MENSIKNCKSVVANNRMSTSLDNAVLRSSCKRRPRLAKYAALLFLNPIAVFAACPTGVVSYEYYEGLWSALPDFSTLTPEFTGAQENFSLASAVAADEFAFRFTATLFVPEAGEHTFYTTSDDGSKLYVGGVEIVSNDGVHGLVEVAGTVTLTAGYHDLEVTYFERSGGSSLSVNWEGPSFAKTAIGPTLSPDMDCDGVANQSEGIGDYDEDGIPDYLDTDSDNDGLDDSVENQTTAYEFESTTPAVSFNPPAEFEFYSGTVAGLTATEGSEIAHVNANSPANIYYDFGLINQAGHYTVLLDIGDFDNADFPDAITSAIYSGGTDASLIGTQIPGQTLINLQPVSGRWFTWRYEFDIAVDDPLIGQSFGLNFDVGSSGSHNVAIDNPVVVVAQDLDNDGKLDYLDLDSDGDGLSDSFEGVGDTNGDGIPNFLDADYGSADTDMDGISDADEGYYLSATSALMEVTTGGNVAPVATLTENDHDALLSLTTLNGNIKHSFAGERKFRLSEATAANGVYTITPSRPLFEAEFLLDNFVPENSVGNFSITLEDGSILNNVDFSIFPDVMTSGAVLGKFDALDTSSRDLGVKDSSTGVHRIVAPANPTDQFAARFKLEIAPEFYDGNGIVSFSFEKFGTLTADYTGHISLVARFADSVSTDVDGTPDYLDLDSDDDGIPDSVEGSIDSDNDGQADFRDLDSDNDGLLDANEGVVDADDDGKPDYQDPKIITLASTEVTGPEDTPIPLGLSVAASLESGGSLLNVLSTETGFRDATAGSTPVTFTIPERTTHIKVTGIGGSDNGVTDNDEEEFQLTSLVVDLELAAYSGHTVFSLDQKNSNDNYAFKDIPLGAASDSEITVGHNTNSANSITLSVVGSQLSLIETQSAMDQVYLVEYLSNTFTSSNYLGASSSYMASSVTTDTLTIPANTGFTRLSMLVGRAGQSASHEDKGFGSVVVDVENQTASGVVFAHTGRGDTYVAGYAFSGYDLTSGVSVLSSAATIVGDVSAAANTLIDPTIQLSGSDLTITRASDTSAIFSALWSATHYERLTVGSIAASLGSSSVSGTYESDFNNPDIFDLTIPSASESGSATLMMTADAAGTSTSNENTGMAVFSIDLVNNTTSGSFVTMRSGIPDFLSWVNVPFGTRLIDDPNTVANHTLDSEFSDQFSAVLKFDLETLPDGSQVLRATAVPGSVTSSSIFLDYRVVMQSQWSGRLPLDLQVEGGSASFSHGSADPVTGSWTIAAEDVAALSYIPDEHISGDSLTLAISYDGEVENIALNITRVADAPTLTTQDQQGPQGVSNAIAAAFSTALVDQDGSETLSTQLIVTQGHTISDGVNSFTATAGNLSKDITTWNQSALTYFTDDVGVFAITVLASTEDDDGFSATNDSAQTQDTFEFTVLLDTDADGQADIDDTDDDNDGIPDTVEGNSDTDNDSIPNYLDTDSDGDGISDAIEGVVDTDNDSIANYIDTDSDNDTISDAIEGDIDTDSDTFANYIDTDSDADGINDNIESAIDSDGDGQPNYRDLDTDNDGLLDSLEGSTDFDNDSIANYLDSDSDADGILDILEGAADSDSDGSPNFIDTDSDADGIPDATEGINDADSDGTLNYLDLDSDDDGISDAQEGALDADTDGTANYLDTDSDADGINDDIEGVVDTDNDGVFNYLDADSDNDGIDDHVEGNVDTDTDGLADYIDADSDGDSILDATEGGIDTDNDGILNYLDLDSDGDGIGDNAEGEFDTDTDGTANYLDIDSDADGINDSIEGVSDTDNDGKADYLDLDSDADGINDSIEGALDSDNDGAPDYVDPDADGDGIADSVEGTVDTDNDGTPDYLDSDSDGDGISDFDEGGADSDGDGILDSQDTDANNDGIPDADLGTGDQDGDGVPDYLDDDIDGDGLANSSEGAPNPTDDSDGDGIPNYADTDSDNDGISDAIEGNSDIDGDGVPDALDTDSDGDGILDAVEGTIDSDGDGVSDYADTDSDGDGVPDITEGTHDADSDGIADYLDEDADGDGVLDSTEGDADSDSDGIPDYLDTDSDGDGLLDAMEGDGDSDADGIADYLDNDSDNDGILDTTEGALDSDGDGVANYLDLDSDGDGILDIVEGSSDSDLDGAANYLDLDSDNDGLGDATEGLVDSDGDGIADALDPDSDNDGIPDSVEAAGDTDADGIADYLDTDSDNDGIPDGVEATLDTDGDGAADYLDTDSDNDNIPDSLEGPFDNDGDGIPDYLDADSDNDGIPDSVEGSGDSDGDGVADSIDTDANGDGIPDAALGVGDIDGDGIPDYLDGDIDGDGIANGTEGSVIPAEDTDGDGIPNYADTDSDNDGILDSDEGTGDADGDGIPDALDTDSDNDGIADSAEGLSDTDRDGIPDYLDTDSDGDGINDVQESAADADGDGVPNYLDSDSDGDGIDDAIEGTTDADSDGAANYLDSDSDGDGIPDSSETTVDTDADGIADYLDADSDGDGIPDIDEGSVDTDGDGVPNSQDVDANGDGIPDSALGNGDADGDGIPDYLDGDIDGDGMANGNEGSLNPAADTDGDGIPNYADTDSDNDGILDSEEGAGDADGDGLLDAFDSDSDNDGILDGDEGSADTDGDGIPDYLDPDSDNDGIPDSVEGLGDSDGDGIPDSKDTDGNNDGIPDSELSSGDTDGDGIPDYLDNDIDGDGVSNVEEAMPDATTDSDGDGLPDYIDTDSDNDGVPDSLESRGDSDGDGIPDFADTDADGDGVPDLLEGSGDSDGDGVPNYIDLDADNDGLLDSLEGSGDFDGDGIPDALDLDSDNDGLPDLLEAGEIDVDADGRIDNPRDLFNDGLDDGIAALPMEFTDSDRDGKPDHRDLDSDNDGIPDTQESGSLSLDANGDGLLDDFVDVNGDGWSDNVPLDIIVDTDNDNVPDHRDLDSDNDGITDIVEAGGVDENGDGIADGWLDSDADGIPDSVDVDQIEFATDADGDGIADFADVDFLFEDDSDGDGIVDRFDIDPFNEGFARTESGEPLLGAALPDTDGDGVADVREPINEQGFIRTGVRGSGSFGPLSFLLLGVPAFLLARKRQQNCLGASKPLKMNNNRKRSTVSLLGVVFLIVAFVMNTTGSGDAMANSDVEQNAVNDKPEHHTTPRVYFGLGVGTSRLDPDTREVQTMSVDDRVGVGGQITLGMDTGKQTSVELHAADLGSAGLSPEGQINYSTYGVSGLFYVGKNRGNAKRHGITGFARLGIGFLENEAQGNVPFQQTNSMHLLMGAGIEYMGKNGLGIRSELISYDKDVLYGQLALIYRMGLRADELMRKDYVSAPLAEPVLAAAVVADTPPRICESAVESVQSIYFEKNSDELSPRAKVLIAELRQQVQGCNERMLVLNGHADSRGLNSHNQALSEQRARMVSQHLLEAGVGSINMTVLGFGERQPIADNYTIEGRRLNRRVDIQIQQAAYGEYLCCLASSATPQLEVMLAR